MAERTENKGNSILEIDEGNLTPGMRQYREVKEAHPDCLVMLRMGDFYEMFYEDAIIASKELEITLTARGKGDKRAPLAGVPYHALDSYLGKLVKKGHKVAIVEQLEDPKLAKGLVKRGLMRIITPGTVMESSLLNEKENNFIMALTANQEEHALAFCDLSTGEFFTTIVSSTSPLFNEIARYNPSECVFPESLKVNRELICHLEASGCFLAPLEDYFFSEEKARKTLLGHFQVPRLDAFGLEEQKLNLVVSGALLHYLISTQRNTLPQIKRISVVSSRGTMLLDATTLRNLELIKNIRDGTPRGTLLNILDQTVTAMGSRLIRKWLKNPLLDILVIRQRQEAIAELNQSIIFREEVIGLLEGVYDLERLISRVGYGNASPRDLLSLRNSLQKIPLIKEKLRGKKSFLLQHLSHLPELDEVTNWLIKALREDAPLTVREGGIIKAGYSHELDQLQDLKKNSRRFLQELEERERRKTGIATLKIGYTQVFGYFIEVTKKNLPLVPSHYIRKQTTSNAERYITEELKSEEEKILGAEEKIIELEYRLFRELVEKVAGKMAEIQDTAAKLAVLDVLCSLAKVAMENNYSCPEFTGEKIIQLKNSRHPVLEKTEEHFITNDIIIQPGEMMIITGPNMSGKSTLMRQVALTILMAQMGSFVPVAGAMLGIVDRIFTRAGAYDDLSSGQSTFMVEMSETASILNNATENSLIILDEIGRGTSTFDGVSLAWSVAEHIHQRIKAKTLFSTHYHVLNKLGENFSQVKNYNIAVREVKGEVIFLHKLVEGGTDQSYGIQVAKLAGLPIEVVERAKEIQAILEKDDEMVRKIKAKRWEEQRSLEGF